MLNHYITIKRDGVDEKTIQKSRFIGYARRVETEADAKSFIEEIKKKHHDATHNCSAYIIGEHDQIQKANDDGEPSGTAGVPILEVLKKQHLKDTAIVITRYFGAIKLGAGGLIRAYSGTTTLAIDAAGVVCRELMQGFSITVTYPLLGKLENELRQSTYLLTSINYLENVEFIVHVKMGDEDAFLNWIINLTSDQAEIKKTDQIYVEIDQ